MRLLSLLYATAAFGLAVSPVAEAAEKVPPALAAKRAGLQPQGRATLPPSSSEMLFTPISGCRAFKQMKIMGNHARVFKISGATNFEAQGGPTTGCGIPAHAQAVSISLTAVSAAKGVLTAYPQGAAKPPVTLLNYPASQASTAGATVMLSATGQIAVFSSQTATVLGDVTGYYLPQMWVYGSSSGTIIDSSARVVSSTKSGTGVYTVVWDRDVSACAGTASSDISGYIISVYTAGPNSYIYVYNNAGTPTDYWFNVQITC